MFHSQWRFLLISSYFCLQSAIDLKKTPPLFNRASSQSIKTREHFLITVYMHSLFYFLYLPSVCFLLFSFSSLRINNSSVTVKHLIFHIYSSMKMQELPQFREHQSHTILLKSVVLCAERDLRPWIRLCMRA